MRNYRKCLGTRYYADKMSMFSRFTVKIRKANNDWEFVFLMSEKYVGDHRRQELQSAELINIENNIPNLQKAKVSM